jgi:hypothetical protein
MPPPEPPPTPWQFQSEEDVSMRRNIIIQIIFILESLRERASTEYLQAIPGMAQRLEYTLYRQACNREAYMENMNTNTLKQRLYMIAIDNRQRSNASRKNTGMIPKLHFF